MAHITLDSFRVCERSGESHRVQRATTLNDGGLVFEDDKPNTPAEAMAALEKGLIKHFNFKEEGIEID